MIRAPMLGWRNLPLLLVGVLVGTIMIDPAVAHFRTSMRHLQQHFDGRYVNESSGYTRRSSCAGLNFYPTDSATGYTNLGVSRTRVGTDGTGVFRCDPHLPDGAVVTKVEFTTETSGDEIQSMALVRSNSTPAIGVETMALIAESDESVERHADASISFATVNNNNYGYWLEFLHTGEAAGGVVGATVTYRITAARGGG